MGSTGLGCSGSGKNIKHRNARNWILKENIPVLKMLSSFDWLPFGINFAECLSGT